MLHSSALQGCIVALCRGALDAGVQHLHLLFMTCVCNYMCCFILDQCTANHLQGSSELQLSLPVLLCPAVDWSSKMSAAAYISRAHAAALAASAERRTQPHQVAASPAAASSPVTSCHGGFAGDPGSVGSSAATAYLSVSPTTGGPREVSGDGSGSWLSKRPRNSSTGSGAILAGQDRDRDDLLQHQAAGLVGVDGRRVGEVAFIGGVSSATGAASGSSSAPGQKISATEQLRLTQSAFRASSASGGHASHHHSSSSSSSINMQAGGAGEVEYSSDTATDVVGPLHQPAQQQQAKHRTGHRRFASMGAVQ